MSNKSTYNKHSYLEDKPKKKANVDTNKFSLKEFDEDGNEIENKDGTTKEFRLKDNIRYKPLEYVCEDLSPDMLEEVK